MESEDYSFYSGLHYILGHNISDLGYDLTFATEVSLCTLFFSGGVTLLLLLIQCLFFFVHVYFPVGLFFMLTWMSHTN